MIEVRLTRPYATGTASFETLKFREPTLAHYRKHGRVIEEQRGVIVTYGEAVWNYADALVESIAPGALGTLDLVDAIGVEKAFIGFFLEAHGRWSAHASSSSGSAGAPPT